MREQLRLDCRAKRDAIPVEERTRLNQLICQRAALLLTELSQPPGLVAVYRKFQSEADLDSLIAKRTDLTWAYPKVVDHDLVFYRASSDEDFTKGKFGIWEPLENRCAPVSLNECAVIFVPGIAFDRRGGRLGTGRGFYDRALAHYRGIKVGVAFGCQVVDFDLPLASHDVYMDYLIAEDYTLFPLEKKRD